MPFQQMEWTPERVRRFWAYEANFPENYYSYKYGRQILDRAEELLAPAARSGGAAWLDYGCGYGSFTDLLLDRGYQVVIHDLSAESLERCRSRVATHPGFRGTLAEYDGRIDVVTLLEVVEHVDSEAMGKIVSELRGACDADAELLISTPNQEDLEAASTQVYCPACDTVRHRWQHLRRFDRDTLARQLSELGLDRIRVAEHNFRRDKRFATSNPLRRLKRIVCDRRLWRTSEKPNLLAAARLGR